MAITWKNLLAIVCVAIALFLLAAVPAVEASEQSGFSTVDDSTELIADNAIDSGNALKSREEGERLSGAPGGDYAIGGGSSNGKVTACKVTSESKVTDHAKEVLPGGAAGVAANGIRGPTAV